jgi:hypothetical protein
LIQKLVLRVLTALAVGIAVGLVGCAAPELAVRAPIHVGDSLEGIGPVVEKYCEPDSEAARRVWEEYRKYRPFHAQEVAVSPPLSRGCRTLIISEPPPGVTAADLVRAHPLIASLKPRQHPLGVDGWVEDLVGVMPPLDDDAMSELTSDLHVALFGTAYRGRLAPIRPETTWRGTLNVEVRPAELYAWVFGAGAMFWPVDGGAARPAAELLSPGRSGVYTSSTPGVVLWSLPKKGTFDEQRANVRMFGLEADLVLGAVANDTAVLVIGRERIAPVDVLPPLRFETVKLLATTSLPQLAQSYERLQLFAGPRDPFSHDSVDWAPILLSPVLLDTELGSVLNIADQLLKRWSLNGTIDYEGFDYPRRPARWAFDKPLAEVFGTASLTFNWNTAATGGIAPLIGGRDLYWMARTGALNVSYLPDHVYHPSASQYEELGRAFFAEQSDPYLVRAVQYGALFQAFRGLGVTAADAVEEIEWQVGVDEATGVLETLGERALRRAAGATDAEIEGTSRRIAARDVRILAQGRWKAQIEAELRTIPAEQREEALATNLAHNEAKIAAELAKDARLLRDRLSRAGAAAPRHLSVALVHHAMAMTAVHDHGLWEDLTNKIRSTPARDKAAAIDASVAFLQAQGFKLKDRAAWPREAEEWRRLAARFAEGDVETQYRRAADRRRSTAHLRTPSIVRSKNGKLGLSGGHNVGARVPKLLQPIEPELLPHLAVVSDGMRATVLAEPLRDRPAALGGIAARSPATAPPAIAKRAPAPAAPPGGWASLPSEPSFGGATNSVAIKLTDTPDGRGVSVYPQRSRYKVDVGDRVLRAGSMADVAEVVTRKIARETKSGKRGAFAIKLLDHDLTPDEARGLARTLHVRLGREGVDEAYVLFRGEQPIDIGDFDLARAVVSAPERAGDGYSVSVHVPRKSGTGKRLLMRLLGRGKPAADVQQAEAALRAGVRSPEEIARDLKARFAKEDDTTLLELTLDAQDTKVDNARPARRWRHAGAPGQAF